VKGGARFVAIADAGARDLEFAPAGHLPMVAQPITTNRLRVLVAEDDTSARAVLCQLLTALGHEVVAQASTGSEAVELVAQCQPDVALLDFHMPGMTGLDAAEAMRETAPAVAAVLLTGDLDISLTQYDPNVSNAVAILAKPVRPGMLDATLKLAVCRMRERTSAQRDVVEALRRLEERKIIEKAKGILMRRVGGDEEEAYRILRRTSQDRARPMVEIARIVLQSEQGARMSAASKAAQAQSV
jgi:response regulator NasT